MVVVRVCVVKGDSTAANLIILAFSWRVESIGNEGKIKGRETSIYEVP